MNQILKKIYEDANSPGFQRFYKSVKAEHPLFKKIDIKKFYDSKISVQLLKKKDNKIKKHKALLHPLILMNFFKWISQT